MLGAAGKTLAAAPALASGSIGLAANAIGLGIPAVGLNSVVKGMNVTGKNANKVAEWRMFRMNVKNGLSKPEAAAKTYAASKIHKAKTGLRTVKKVKAVKTSVKAGNTAVSKVLKTDKGLGMWDKMKAMYSNAGSNLKEIGSGAHVASRYY